MVSISNRDVEQFSQVALLLAAFGVVTSAVLGSSAFGHNAGGVEHLGLSVAAGYVFASLSFVSFPCRRRSDLAAGAAAAVLIFGLVDVVLARRLNLGSLLCGPFGVYAGYLSTFVESYRSYARLEPTAAFGASPQHDRRKRSLLPASRRLSSGAAAVNAVAVPLS